MITRFVPIPTDISHGNKLCDNIICEAIITSVIGASALSTVGGDQITLVGDMFGPVGTSNWIEVAYTEEYANGMTPGLDQYSPSRLVVGAQCSVSVAQTEIVCGTNEGVGTSLRWRVRVSGGLDSVWAVTWSPWFVGGSYAPPFITSVEFSASGSNTPTINTRGGESVTIHGDNFGFMTGEVVVDYWNSQTLSR